MLALASAPGSQACQFCTEGANDPSSPNTFWSLGDSVAACPAGDSLAIGGHAGHPHPSKLRIEVWYADVNCLAKVGVPPESIWVSYSTASGNLKVNDKSTNVYADDSTDACGHTWITIPSFSGCGTLSLSLHVSGIFQGTKTAIVRTTDMNADGRANSGDLPQTCDLNYDGQILANDGSIVLSHPSHWHRHALHGTLVRRTNLRNSGSGLGNNAIGNGGIFWSPNGRRIVYSARDTCPPPTCSAPKNPCRIKWVFSDPALGNDVFNLTFNADGSSLDDYDPSWSPLGGYVYYVRADQVIRRKGVPGLNPDVSDVAIIGAAGGQLLDQAQISPDGDSLAFAESVGGFSQIFIAPAAGGSKRQLTSSTDARWRDPYWSPDGRYLTVTREDANPPHQSVLYKIDLQGPTATRFYPILGDNSTDAQWPAVSADSQIVVAGVGANPNIPHTTHTIEGAVSTTEVAIQNYPAHTFGKVYPRLSPDGTRLALLGKDPALAGATLPQVWAVRRNMNGPPQIIAVGTQNVADSTVVVAISAKQGLQTNVQILASDPEGDPITCRAAYLNDGMTFNPGNCTLTWTPSAPVGTKFRVVFRVATTTWPNASGGSDAIIGEFTVTDPLLAPGLSLSPLPEEATHEADGPNPTSGAFALRTPLVAGAVAELAIFDLSGRRIALVRGRAGSRLVWSGETSAGTRVPSGVYLYRLTAGPYLKTGRVVHVR